jgi:hypothetical protein
VQIPHVPPSLTTLGLLRPLAAALTASGFATWNVEYRRLGNGGGWPTTYGELGTAVDRLRELAPAYHLDLEHPPPSAADLLPIGVRQEISQPARSASDGAGDSVNLHRYDDAGHVDVIDPQSVLWPAILEAAKSFE